MYCHNCAKENSAELRFCRFCGMTLQTVSRVLSEHLAAGNAEEQMTKPSPLRAAALASRRGARQKALPQSGPDVAGAAMSFPEAMPSVTELITRNLDAIPETAPEESTGNTQPTV